MASRVEGRQRLVRRLGRLPGRVVANVQPIVHAAAEELVEFQKRLVPRDDDDLYHSIRSEPGRDDLSRLVKAGDERAFYARMIEFGTVKMPARPFFFPPYRASRSRIRGKISRGVRKAVRTPA